MLSHEAWHSQVMATQGRVDGQEVSSVGNKWPLVKVPAVTAPFCSRVALRVSSVGFFPEGLAQGHPPANGRLTGWHPGSRGWGLFEHPKTSPRAGLFPPGMSGWRSDSRSQRPTPAAGLCLGALGVCCDGYPLLTPGLHFKQGQVQRRRDSCSLASPSRKSVSFN